MQQRHPAEDISDVPGAWSDEDPRALDGLTPIAYDELHRLDRRYLREPPGHGEAWLDHGLDGVVSHGS